MVTMPYLTQTLQPSIGGAKKFERYPNDLTTVVSVEDMFWDVGWNLYFGQVFMAFHGTGAGMGYFMNSLSWRLHFTQLHRRTTVLYL